MSLQLEPTVPADLEAISALLIDGFKASPDALFVDRNLLKWKYFEPGPQWEGSRGYVLRQGDSIQAHCGIWPINLSVADRTVSCVCFLDWVSDRSSPGVGFLLKKKLMRYADTAIEVGGSDDTRAIIPRLQFELVGQVGFFVQVVRPWKQFRTRPSEGIGRDAARLVRNAAWSRALIATSILKDWTAVPLKSFGGIAFDGGTHSEHPIPWRSAEYLDYWLRSPMSEVSGFAIRDRNKTLGYFLLSRVGGQTRIADVRLRSTKQDEWNVAYSLAAQSAAEIPETCEIMAVSSTVFSEIALLSSGFRQRGGAPLFLYDPQKKLSNSPAIFWNLIDADAAYIQDPDHPYTT